MALLECQTTVPEPHGPVLTVIAFLAERTRPAAIEHGGLHICEQLPYGAPVQSYAVREATPNDDMERIYMMGFDVWGAGDSVERYLHGCATSTKYQGGLWMLLQCNTAVVASLLLHRNGFGLPCNALGLGSLATAPESRRKGYGTSLMRGVLQSERCRAAPEIYLHSDISPAFYEKFGFEKMGTSAPGTMCMVRTSPTRNATDALALPKYF